MKRIIIYLIVLHTVFAQDKIITNDNSTIVGKIQQIHAGKLKIKTDFAGVLTIALKKIKSIQMSAESNIGLKKAIAWRVNSVLMQTNNRLIRVAKRVISSFQISLLWGC